MSRCYWGLGQGKVSCCCLPIGGIVRSLSATSPHQDNTASIRISCQKQNSVMYPQIAGESTQVLLKLKYRFPLCRSVCNQEPVSHVRQEMFIILRTFAKLPSNPHDRIIHQLIDQPEGVIEHKIAACAVRKQLEDLGVVHWPLLLVDLQNEGYVINYHRQPFIEPGLTSSAPVTMTNIPPLSFEGCASRVATLCSTLSNGRVLD